MAASFFSRYPSGPLPMTITGHLFQGLWWCKINISIYCFSFFSDKSGGICERFKRYLALDNDHLFQGLWWCKMNISIYCFLFFRQVGQYM